MTTANPDPFTRLADALTDVSSRLRDIGEELRSLPSFGAGSSASATRHPAPRTAPSPAVPYPSPAVPYPTPGVWSPTPGGPYQGVQYPPPGVRYPSPPAPLPDPGVRYPTHGVPEQPWQPSAFWSGGASADGWDADLGDARDRSTVWERLSREGAGSRTLAWVGGVVTLAGVVLLLVLAIQRGYVGPLPRVLSGAALGGLLVGLGVRLHLSPAGRAGAHAVAATGVAVGYLDVLAATASYSYLPAWAGLAVGLGVAAGGLAIAAWWDSQLFAGFVVLCCALSAPILTGGFVALLIGFLLVLQIATVPIQLRKRWSALALVSGAPPVVAVLISLCLAPLDRGTDATATAVLCLVTGIVQIIVATVSAGLRPEDVVPAGLLLAGPVPTLLSVVLVSRFLAVAMIGGIGALLTFVWVLQRFGALQLPRRYAEAAAAAGALAGFEATCIGFEGDARAIALLAAGLLLAVLAERMSYAGALGAATVFAAAGLLAALIGPVRPRFLTVAPVRRLPFGTVVTAGTTGLLLVATVLVLGWAAARQPSGDDERGTHLRWVLTGGIALYGATAAVLSIGLGISPDTRGFLVGHVLVTVSWTVGALVLLLRHADSTPLRVAGLALVGAALAKLVTFDLSSLSGIPRVMAFLGAGLVLLAAGARYAQLAASRDRQHEPA